MPRTFLLEVLPRAAFTYLLLLPVAVTRRGAKPRPWQHLVNRF
jgi:hypothetical protein